MSEGKYKLKKLVKTLKSKKGRHTELVTVYVPAGYNLHEITSQLKQEQGTSENIKSKSVRKNVTTALEKIMRHIQLYKQTPENGLALFCGNVSEKEGAADIELWAIEPPEPIKTKLYWCDQKFVMEPLEKMVEEKQIYGVVCLDKSEADIGLLRGKKLEPLVHFDSIVPGKTRAGGQCLLPETLVMKSDGNIAMISELHNPNKVLTVNMATMELEKTDITDKWETKKSGVKITSKYPRTEIICSNDHTFFVIGDTIAEKSARELIVGEHLLMPETVRIKGAAKRFETNIYYNSYIVNEKGRHLLKKKRAKQNLFQRELAKKSDVTQTAISSIEIGKRDIKAGLLKELCRALGIDFTEFVKKYCKPKSGIILPKKLTPELAQFIGYFSGDGSFEAERLTLHERDSETILKYRKITEPLFRPNIRTRFRESKNYYDMRIYGKPIVRFIRNEFPEITGALETRIPSVILRANDKVLSGFLKGFFDAEGYVIKGRGIGLGINNKIMAQQIQLCFLRFGIVASLNEYDNRRNPYSDRPRFVVSFDDKESLEKFQKYIGFSCSKKRKSLEKLVKRKSHVSYKRQIIVTGKAVRAILEAHGMKISDFSKVTNFFRNERQMSKRVFLNSILKEIKDKELKDMLKKLCLNELIAVKIASITPFKEGRKMVDISVANRNFIANGLVVHNSSARFSRIREGLLNDFLKEVGDAVNKTFLDKKEVVGILLGGPGPIKDILLKENYIDNNVKKNILGTVDVGSTGEHGLYETIQRGEHLIKESLVIQEKKILQQFFEGLQKGSLVTYGLDSVIKALKMGAVDTVIVTEEAPYEEIELECQCGLEKKFVRIGKDVKCSKCNQIKKILGRKEIVEALEELVKDYSTKLEVVSSDTREGEQFAELGGIGAILRYEI